MGYDVHITRKNESWADEDDDAAISLNEWKKYVVNDPEIRLDNHAEALVHGTDTTVHTRSRKAYAYGWPTPKMGVGATYLV